MIPAVEILDDGVNIPIYGTSDYCFIEWKEDDTYEDALIKAQGGERNFISIYTIFKIWPSDIEESDSENEEWDLRVYEIQCKNTEIKYFLISYWEISEFDDIRHCVCIPFNALNLFKFYRNIFGDLSYKFRSN